MSNVIITGAGNGIGKAVFELSKSRGNNTISYDIERNLDVTKPIELDVKPDILVNCAGITAGGWIKDNFIIEQTKKVMEVNLFGMMNMIHWALKRMDTGAIVNIASKSAFKPISNRLAYCVSKGAVVSLSKQLALDLSPHIRVNSISPGTIDTDMPGSLVSTLDKIDNLVERKGTPEEVARFILDVAENKYITGQDFIIDGGFTIK